MSTLDFIVSKDANGQLSYNSPTEVPFTNETAIELSSGGKIRILIGAGFSANPKVTEITLQDKLNPATTATINLNQPNPQAVTLDFGWGSTLKMYESGGHPYIEDTTPSSGGLGEGDIEFSLKIADDAGNYNLDPEIRVRSGTGTATWAPPAQGGFGGGSG